MFAKIVQVFLWFLLKLLWFWYIPINFIRLFLKPKKLPPINNKLLLLSASEIARRIRTKEISSLRVVQSYIARIQEVNSMINAVIEERFEDALKDAIQVDNFLQVSPLNQEQISIKYPLLGVPITIKGSLAVSGMKHTSGMVDRNLKAKEDAIAVKLARDAGAIPILTSNVPELCLNWETTNKRTGTTRNPYNTTRTAGGSSGGETSLMGSGASLIGLGSDIGGSLRLPAHFCGVWGHKPSPLAVSCVGHYPDCKNRKEWDRTFTVGPMARYAPDLRLLLEVILEPHIKQTLRLQEKVDLEKIQVYYMTQPGGLLPSRPNQSIVDAVERVVYHLQEVTNSECTKIKLPLMKYSAELSYLHLLQIDDIDNVFEGKGEGAYSELFKFLTCRSKHELSSIFYGLIRRNLKLIPQSSLEFVHTKVEELRQQLLTLLGDGGVLICPSFPKEAPYHGDMIKGAFEYGCLSIYNALGFPVTNCPVGFTSRGLPVGIQVVAAPNCDRLTLTVAEEIERAFGGWRPPQ